MFKTGFVYDKKESFMEDWDNSIFISHINVWYRKELTKDSFCCCHACLYCDWYLNVFLWGYDCCYMHYVRSNSCWDVLSSA